MNPAVFLYILLCTAAFCTAGFAQSVRQHDSYCGVPNNSTNSLGRSNLKENPWDVILLRILTTRWKPFCYGVLVSAKHVITQSLCTTGLSPNQLQIFAGQLRDKENGEVWETVRDILIPPPFSSFNLPVDIRVLVLDAKLDLYSFPNIKPVCLPWVSHSFSFIGDQGYVSSADITYDVSIKENNICSLWGRKSANRICARGVSRHRCGWVPGTPLMVYDPSNHGAVTLLGISECSSSSCCAEELYSVFADVTQVIFWLKQIISTEDTLPPKPFKVLEPRFTTSTTTATTVLTTTAATALSTTSGPGQNTTTPECVSSDVLVESLNTVIKRLSSTIVYLNSQLD